MRKFAGLALLAAAFCVGVYTGACVSANEEKIPQVSEESGEIIMEARGLRVFDGLEISSRYVKTWFCYESDYDDIGTITNYVIVYDNLEEGCDNELIDVSEDLYNQIIWAKEDHNEYICTLKFNPDLYLCEIEAGSQMIIEGND